MVRVAAVLALRIELRLRLRGARLRHVVQRDLMVRTHGLEVTREGALSLRGVALDLRRDVAREAVGVHGDWRVLRVRQQMR
jgi:hypothetical protein